MFDVLFQELSNCARKVWKGVLMHCIFSLQIKLMLKLKKKKERMDSIEESLAYCCLRETETIDLQSQGSSSYFDDEEAKNSPNFSRTKFLGNKAGN